MSAATIGDNSTASMLGFIERIEAINQDIKDAQTDRKNVYQEAAAAGWNAKALKRVIRERALDREELDEFDELVAQYWGALGR